jgi:hypothetical protein
MEIIRHAWSLQSKNGFWAYCPGENPPKFLFSKPIPLWEAKKAGYRLDISRWIGKP